ncbi:putative phosphatidylinositol N-acetylglucosaminyltransferase subunit Y [Senna tora]|uniref:Putative phosphatidylinositol N-acetylglucosaminyltransferase subunit Y n=1 Tax=Senna tora TaxID=362788 RepID=A0A834STR2_9FABA|nr:putative phosphatidylinositol N-acetylglucosaminyltransferase subunit Y [Senna tora]
MISSKERTFWGWMFVSVGSVFFVGYFFVAIIAKLLPPSNVAIISAMQNDWYYCFLVPLTLPIVFVAVYFHWLSMKMFKHA